MQTQLGKTMLLACFLICKYLHDSDESKGHFSKIEIRRCLFSVHLLSTPCLVVSMAESVYPLVPTHKTGQAGPAAAGGNCSTLRRAGVVQCLPQAMPAELRGNLQWPCAQPRPRQG